MRLRTETPADVDAIDALLARAFADHPHSHQTEGAIVRVLRAAGALSLSLIAEDDGDSIIGYVAASPVRVDGAVRGWYGLAEGTVKRLTGGDRIKARRMRDDFWAFEPSHTFVMLTNYRPIVAGTDEGIWRRLRIVPFDVVILMATSTGVSTASTSQSRRP